MASYGRRPTPGEHGGVSGVLDQESVLNRTVRAQVTAVDPENGFVTLSYESLPGGGRYATVPPLWMSFPSNDIGGPAWGRYMPQQTDMVKLAFDYDDHGHVIGYDIVAADKTQGDGRSGWGELHTQYEGALSSTDPNKAKFAQFIPLNPGEYDFMSSGGAYIYGNDNGRLYLAGGSVSVSLSKNDLRMSSRAQLFNQIADDCELVFGQVRRESSGLATAVGDGKLKEFSIKLKNTSSPGTSLDLSNMQMGNVYDESGGVLVSEFGAEDIRYMYQAFHDDGTQALKQSIDKVGNWEVISFSESVGVTFDFTNADWTTTFKNIDFTASDKFTLTAPTTLMVVDTQFKINSPDILLGNTASHPYLLTNLYRPAEDAWFTGVSAAISSLATAIITLCAGITAASVFHVIPIVGPILGAPLLATTAATVTGLATSIIPQIQSSLTVFNLGQYLSTVVKGQ